MLWGSVDIEKDAEKRLRYHEGRRVEKRLRENAVRWERDKGTGEKEKKRERERRNISAAPRVRGLPRKGCVAFGEGGACRG